MRTCSGPWRSSTAARRVAAMASALGSSASSAALTLVMRCDELLPRAARGSDDDGCDVGDQSFKMLVNFLPQSLDSAPS